MRMQGNHARKLLVITSDDLGMCHAVNTGIVRGMTQGCVTSSNLMAPCPWFPEAAALVKEHRLPVGVHLTLTCEWDRMRFGPVSRAPSLVGPDGYFWTNVPALVAHARDEDILAEFEAQIARVRSHGIEPTHIDMHMIASDDDRPGVAHLHELRRSVGEKHDLCYIREYRKNSGLVHLAGQAETSALPEDGVWKTLASWNEPGLYHLIVHLASPSEELDSICSSDHPARDWAASYRVSDLVLWTKPSTRNRLRDMGFELVDVKTLLSSR